MKRFLHESAFPTPADRGAIIRNACINHTRIRVMTERTVTINLRLIDQTQLKTPRQQENKAQVSESGRALPDQLAMHLNIIELFDVIDDIFSGQWSRLPWAKLHTLSPFCHETTGPDRRGLSLSHQLQFP